MNKTPETDTLVLILAGGRGQRLYPLTKHRTKGAIPFAGHYRLIDFALSNCLHSGLRRICILPQYKFASLERHLQAAWSFFRPELGESLAFLPPQQRLDEDWYQGTADAVYQNIYTIDSENPRSTLVLTSDHIYQMDYRPLVARHLSHGAGATIACSGIAADDAPRYGIVEVDENDRILDLEQEPEVAERIPRAGGRAFASMGIYVFDTQALIEALCENHEDAGSTHDLGMDIIPRIVAQRQAYAFNAPACDATPGDRGFYWRDISVIDAYWEANMEMLAAVPPIDLCNPSWPVLTNQPSRPPARVVTRRSNAGVVAINSLLSPGSTVIDARVERSVLSPGVVVDEGAEIVESVLMDDVTVGPGARIYKTIVGKDVQVPAGFAVGASAETDALSFVVSPGGVVVIGSGTELASNTAGADPAIDS